MGFKLRPGQTGFVHKDCCDCECNSDYVPVLVAGQVTVKNFHCTHYSYNIVSEDGEMFTVASDKVLTEKELNEKTGVASPEKTDDSVSPLDESATE